MPNCQDLEKEIYVDSGKHYTKRQRREDRKVMKRLEAGPKVPYAPREDPKLPEKRKRVDKYAKMRGGKKSRKTTKIGNGRMKGKKKSSRTV
jgi:hypothetical protein